MRGGGVVKEEEHRDKWRGGELIMIAEGGEEKALCLERG